jgi:hypothetical protein
VVVRVRGCQNNKSMINKLLTFLIGWQLFDIVIHVLSGNVEWLRIIASLIVIIWAYIAMKKTLPIMYGYGSLILFIVFNVAWLTTNGFIVKPLFLILVTTSITVHTYLLNLLK